MLNSHDSMSRITILEKSLRTRGVHPVKWRKNSEQQDGKRRGSRATSRTSSRHLRCSPLRCLISSSNHVAWHTKHIVIFWNITFQGKGRAIETEQGIRPGITQANLFARNIQQSTLKAKRTEWRKRMEKLDEIDRDQSWNLWIATSTPQAKKKSRFGALTSASFTNLRYQSGALLMTYTTDCTQNGCGDGSVSREPSGYTSFLVLLTYFIAISFHQKRSEIDHDA